MIRGRIKQMLIFPFILLVITAISHTAYGRKIINFLVGDGAEAENNRLI